MRKYSCSHITPSTCVPYEGDLPEWSKHKDSDECVMISDVIEEIYDELTRIREAIDVRDLGESCVKVPERLGSPCGTCFRYCSFRASHLWGQARICLQYQLHQ